MMKKTAHIITLSMLILSLIFQPVFASAHSGRTDSRGGHKDNRNKSGLGSYHYHCGGHSPHLHPNGECPYSSKKSSSSNKSSSSSSKNTNKSTSVKKSSFVSANTMMTDGSSDIEDVVAKYVRNGSVTATDSENNIKVFLAYAIKTVNIRKEPDSNSEKIGYICDGEKIMVTKAYYTPKWHQVIFEDQIGYASAKLCDLKDIVLKVIQIH